MKLRGGSVSKPSEKLAPDDPMLRWGRFRWSEEDMRKLREELAADQKQRWKTLESEN